MKVKQFSLSYTLSWPPSVFADSPVLNEGEFPNLDQARDVAFGIAQEVGVDVWITEHFGQSSNLVEIVEG